MSKGRIARMLTRANPVSAAYHTREKDKSRKLTLAEKVRLIHGSSKWSSDETMAHWAKLAAMSVGVTNIARGRQPGAPGIAMAKIPGKALSSQTVNPNRSIGSSVASMTPKAPRPPAPPKVGAR